MGGALTEMSGAAGTVTPHEASRVDAVVFAVYGTTRAQARAAAIEPVFRAVSNAVDVPCELAFSGPAVCRLLTRRGAPRAQEHGRRRRLLVGKHPERGGLCPSALRLRLGRGCRRTGTVCAPCACAVRYERIEEKKEQKV